MIPRVLSMLFMLSLLVAPVAGMTQWRIQHPLGTEAIIGCDVSSQENQLFAERSDRDGELCRGERFKHDEVVLERELYSPKFFGLEERYEIPIVIAEYAADLYACPTEFELTSYRNGGLSEETNYCNTLLWAQVKSSELLGEFPIPYADAFSADEKAANAVVKVYRVNVGDKELFAIDDYLDEHLFYEPPGLREGVAYLPWHDAVADASGNWQAQMKVFHQINEGASYLRLRE